LEKQSLDAYLFLRFLKMIILICFVGMCMTWPVLFPVNINGGGNSKELDRLTIGNVKDPNKYYVHLFISWVFLGKQPSFLVWHHLMKNRFRYVYHHEGDALLR